MSIVRSIPVAGASSRRRIAAPGPGRTLDGPGAAFGIGGGDDD
jgi:hypothetical protein